MKAVGTVIMNRVNSSEGEYARVSNGGSIRNIIFQKGQFDCATDNLYGRYNSQNIYNMNPTNEHYEIADWVISGNKLPEARNLFMVFESISTFLLANFSKEWLRNFSYKNK